MNYHKITPVSLENGIGVRTVLWVSGCEHHCPKCHNPNTHDPLSGRPFDKSAEEELFKCLEPDYIEGLTFSGGDPLHPQNREVVTKIAQRVKEVFPNKTIWLYTGYDFNQIESLDIIRYVDVIVDGKYIDAQRVVGKFFGSSNQRIIELKGGHQIG